MRRDHEFGDVVLVPFPFTDHSTAKRRPAAIVSSAAYQHDRHDLIILAITSRTRSTVDSSEPVITRWREAGLLRPSVMKPVVATIEKRLVLRRLGRLDEQDRSSLKRLLSWIFGA